MRLSIIGTTLAILALMLFCGAGFKQFGWPGILLGVVLTVAACRPAARGSDKWLWHRGG